MAIWLRQDSGVFRPKDIACRVQARCIACRAVAGAARVGSANGWRRDCVLSCAPVCIRFQALESTGQWDRTLQDSGDEAIIVTVVLCIGSALVVARLARDLVSVVRSKCGVVIAAEIVVSIVPTTATPAFSSSPPVSLRI